MIRRPPRSTRKESSAASDVYKRQALKINQEQRVRNAKLHSAGHLLDMCYHLLGYTHPETKGYHFSAGAYVEFQGKLDAKEKDKVKLDLEKKINDTIKETPESDVLTAKVCSYEEAGKALGEIPSYLKPGSNVRIVKICSMDKGGPCGGTHVRHIKEIGAVKVEKVKSAGSKAFRIHYQVV
eukprot:TRINITY_DN9333_c0_g1_i19.p1 TRINITY_DN9333_c0_g1~~TRINITY_DN9333_c0_g1_i19.p1  ORF type:complete len:188 (-),score=54.96 TRINITY_DN9333_c0_g1_i19:55-597(-)